MLKTEGGIFVTDPLKKKDFFSNKCTKFSQQTLARSCVCYRFIPCIVLICLFDSLPDWDVSFARAEIVNNLYTSLT